MGPWDVSATVIAMTRVDGEEQQQGERPDDVEETFRRELWSRGRQQPPGSVPDRMEAR